MPVAHRAWRVGAASRPVEKELGATAEGFALVRQIVHAFWESEEAPAGWEQCLLIILLKKGDLSLPGKYRGIMMLESAQSSRRHRARHAPDAHLRVPRARGAVRLSAWARLRRRLVHAEAGAAQATRARPRRGCGSRTW